ncbi:hypothetical protein [Burkholderia ambifaria]|uniref:hypothetical protein n=1 Tax=Burkholderia ambifaria TaxID=152480 RepID=UPI00158B6CC8|nr:hypothetical protein [Burkholderia ambifaria]
MTKKNVPSPTKRVNGSQMNASNVRDDRRRRTPHSNRVLVLLEEILRNPGVGAGDLSAKFSIARDDVVSALWLHLRKGRIRIEKIGRRAGPATNTYYPTSDLDAYIAEEKRCRAEGKRSKQWPAWSESQEADFVKRYPDTDTKSLAAEFGLSVPSTHKAARILGLYKSDNYIARQWANGLSVVRDYPIQLLEVMVLHGKLRKTINGKH